MKIAYFPNQTALQSEPVWQSFLDGCRQIGLEPVENSKTADCALIWSVLWNGRMRLNESVYNYYRRYNKPVFIIEVGSLDRGRTWKISANHITVEGIYGNNENLDLDRSKKLGIDLQSPNLSRKDSILILGQHEKSLQWKNCPPTKSWVLQKIQEIRQYTDRPIVFRPHPRWAIRNFDESSTITIDNPVKLINTYDQFNVNFGYHCIINHNSGTGVQTVLAGSPIICDPSSLAYEMSGNLSNIDHITLPDRTRWFQKILHTEWTVEEIRQGIPQKRILFALGH